MWQWSVFFCSFLCRLRVVVSMCQRCLQCWQVLSLTLFSTHVIYQYHLLDARPYAWSLVLWSICLRSSVVNFKKGPGYPTSGTAQVFISLIRFTPYSLRVFLCQRVRFNWSLILQEPCEYSDRSQQCCSLDSLDSWTDNRFFQSFFQYFWNCYKCTNDNWYHHHTSLPQNFISLARSMYLSAMLASLLPQDSKFFC